MKMKQFIGGIMVSVFWINAIEFETTQEDQP